MAEQFCMKWNVKKNVEKEKGVLLDFDRDSSSRLKSEVRIMKSRTRNVIMSHY